MANQQSRAPTLNSGASATSPIVADSHPTLPTIHEIGVPRAHKSQLQLAPIIPPQSPRGSTSPKSARISLSPLYSPYTFTGAAAMAEARQQRDQRMRRDSRQTTPNPGQQAVQSLLGQGTSAISDAPPITSDLSEPLAKVAKSIQIRGAGGGDAAQISPQSATSFAGLEAVTAPTVPALEAPVPIMNADNAPPIEAAMASRMSDQDQAGDTSHGDPRAYTFPGPMTHSTPNARSKMPWDGSSADKRLGRASSLSQGGKRHKCPYCNTDFTRHHNLKSHLLTHSQEKPYECRVCNSRFRRLHDLKRHSKLHTGERPHTCPKCGRRFARGDALARHNKGSGGCAGRRSSFGAPGGPEDGGMDESMDGLEYSEHQTEEPERMDEDDEHDHRAEVAHMRGVSATYPPIQGAPVPGRSMYPPPPVPAGSGSNATGSSGRSGDGVSYLPAAQSAYGPVGMTESPRPLSPGQDHGHRNSVSARGADHAPFGPRSRTSSNMGPNSNVPQLPPISSRLSGPSVLSHQSIPPPMSHGSQPGSHSSHERSSGGSMRELVGNGHQPVDVWNLVRDLEARMSRRDQEHETTNRGMREEIVKQQDTIRTMNEEILRLNSEIKDLKSGRQ